MVCQIAKLKIKLSVCLCVWKTHFIGLENNVGEQFKNNAGYLVEAIVEHNRERKNTHSRENWWKKVCPYDRVFWYKYHFVIIKMSHRMVSS